MTFEPVGHGRSGEIPAPRVDNPAILDDEERGDAAHAEGLCDARLFINIDKGDVDARPGPGETLQLRRVLGTAGTMAPRSR